MEVIVVIGGGAAGFFGAINVANKNRGANVYLLEKARALLSKVRVSGGGRCNVTHACFDPKILTQNYPRGGKELLAPFYRFQPKDTINWFKERGVLLKTEADGRMFPITDSSETIISCLMDEAKKAHVEIKRESNVCSIVKDEERFKITFEDKNFMECDSLLIATGSNSKMYELIKALGHTIVPPVPSLFTFSVDHPELHKLSGVSHSQVAIKIKNTPFQQTGSLLITHWGFSGPAVLKLSAFAARELFEKNYHVELILNWTEGFSEHEVKEKLLQNRTSKRSLISEPLFGLSKNLWRYLVLSSGILETTTWHNLSNKEMNGLQEKLRRDSYRTSGKCTNKEEFVTAGGVLLEEVNFKTMESKICPRLYFAGEVLDIDGVTGGFNFQNAWTTAWIASESIHTT